MWWTWRTTSKTGIVPPADVDVILVAPKGSGTSLRRLFLKGEGINSSIAVFQDATGRAKDKAIALGIGVGSGYLFETDFQNKGCRFLIKNCRHSTRVSAIFILRTLLQGTWRLEIGIRIIIRIPICVCNF